MIVAMSIEDKGEAFSWTAYIEEPSAFHAYNFRDFEKHFPSHCFSSHAIHGRIYKTHIDNKVGVSHYVREKLEELEK